MLYKGYVGSVELSENDGVFCGKVQGVQSLISYEGKSVQEFVDDFHKAVDDYLALCEAEGSEPEVTGSLLLQEVLALEQTVRDFDHQSVDLSALTDAELYGIETSKLPLYALHDKAYKERLRRCDVRAEEQRKEQGRLKARYGYRYPDLNEFNAMDVMRAEAYEKGVVKGALGCCDEAAARAKIHEVIPTITDAEIDEYWKQVDEHRRTAAHTAEGVGHGL